MSQYVHMRPVFASRVPPLFLFVIALSVYRYGKFKDGVVLTMGVTLVIRGQTWLDRLLK
jgi:hypothetical protein